MTVLFDFHWHMKFLITIQARLCYNYEIIM